MKKISTYTDESTEGLDDAWDFKDQPNDDNSRENIWKIEEDTNDGYPYLKDVYQRPEEDDQEIPGFSLAMVLISVLSVIILRRKTSS